MQIILIILVATILFEARAPVPTPAEPLAALLTALAPPWIALAWQRGRVRRAERLLDRADQGGARAVDRAERAMQGVGWAAVGGLAVASFAFGWVTVVRSLVGDWPGIDEALALAPAILPLVLAWWIHEPLERRIREAALVRRLDQGLPIPPAPSRLAFTISRVRSALLLLLVPVLAVVTLGEVIGPLIRRIAPPAWASAGAEIALFLAAALVYLFSPWIARLVLVLRPLPTGALRDDLLSVCSACGVRVRNVLLWDTDHAMVNGAVMGLLPGLRYVMLTDALVELLPRDELRAVMAHEIGHVRRRHLPWMVGALLSLIGAASILFEWPLHALLSSAEGQGASAATLDALAAWLGRGAAVASGLLALLGFGWVSRRFERQADTFAAQYLSRTAGAVEVTPGAVLAMAGALGSVARYAAVDPARRSWRHGSIQWRQRYLAGIAGRRLDSLAIDRLVGRIKLLTLLGLALLAWQIGREVIGGP